MARSYLGSIVIFSGHLGHRLFYFERGVGKKNSARRISTPMFSEPASRLEIMKHVTCYGKILSERDLELEMAPQEVISTDRRIGLR